MRRLLAATAGSAFLVAAAVAAAGCGGGAPQTTNGVSPRASIVVDRSIGPISIGLPERRVIGRLGRPESSLPLYATDREQGLLARYRSHGAQLLIVYDSTRHVVSIQTYSPYYRTANGLGPGASLTRASKFEGFRQNSCDFGYWNATRRTPRNGVVTVFTPNGPRVESALITRLRFDTTCAQSGRGLEPRPNVVVDRSIGGVVLGMAERAVVRLLGKPSAGGRGAVARYVVAGAPFVVTYDAARRVVSLRAFSTFFFTPAGIGPGSPSAFVAAVRGFARDPCRRGFWNAPARASPARPVTVFTLRNDVVSSVLVAKLRRFACRTR